jgi:cytochrome c2
MVKRYSAIGTYALAVSLAAACIGWAAGAPATPKVPKEWKFTFPEGDPKAGKIVFMEMKCHSCHAIEIPGEKTSRAKGAGPELTGYSALPKEYLAESIIKSHTMWQPRAIR